MMRFSAALLLALVSVTTVCAENQIGISAGAGPAFPLRGIKRLFGTGYGGTGSLEVLLNDNISVFARGGYYRWQFSSEKITASLAAAGGETGLDIAGPFQAIPVMVGARLAFGGALLRPYMGLSGGACFLHWRYSGTASRPGALPPAGEMSSSWSEPAMSVDAGFRFVLSRTLTLDFGGTYTAFSNADDRVEPADFFGMKIAGLNTSTFVGVQAGFTVEF
jgi:hypothetical protein